MEIKREYFNNGKIMGERYFQNNELHRWDGPAWTEYYKNGNIRSEGYYLNGKPHRQDGPAYIFYYPNGCIEIKYYYLNGEKVTDEFQIMVIKGLETK